MANEENITEGRQSSRNMGEIWRDHRDYHQAAKWYADKVHRFVSMRVPKHGLTHDELANDPNSDDTVIRTLHNHTDRRGVSALEKMTMSETKELEDHLDNLKHMQTKRDEHRDEHDEHDRFRPTIKRAIAHGLVGDSSKSLGEKMNQKRDASADAMEEHSDLRNENSDRAKELRKAHDAEYSRIDAAAEAKPSKVSSKRRESRSDDESEHGGEGIIKRGVKAVGRTILNAAVDTLVNRNRKTRR